MSIMTSLGRAFIWTWFEWGSYWSGIRQRCGLNSDQEGQEWKDVDLHDWLGSPCRDTGKDSLAARSRASLVLREGSNGEEATLEGFISCRHRKHFVGCQYHVEQVVPETVQS